MDRKVKIFEYTVAKQDGRSYHCMAPYGESGIFVKYGINFEELETGPGHYTSAIIELIDGTVKNVPVETIKFIKD